VNGSATFTGLTALADMLAGLDWPTLAESSGVGVWIGDPDDGDHAGAGMTESVVVVSQPESPEQEWATMGDFARYEQFAAVVVVTSLILGRTCREVICRLQELTLVVESAIREAAPLLANPLSGGPVADMAAAGLWAIGLNSPAWSVQPTQEGYGGRAVIRVGFKARI